MTPLVLAWLRVDRMRRNNQRHKGEAPSPAGTPMGRGPRAGPPHCAVSGEWTPGT